jgi:hypothetical protein
MSELDLDEGLRLLAAYREATNADPFDGSKSAMALLDYQGWQLANAEAMLTLLVEARRVLEPFANLELPANLHPDARDGSGIKAKDYTALVILSRKLTASTKETSDADRSV